MDYRQLMREFDARERIIEKSAPRILLVEEDDEPTPAPTPTPTPVPRTQIPRPPKTREYAVCADKNCCNFLYNKQRKYCSKLCASYSRRIYEPGVDYRHCAAPGCCNFLYGTQYKYCTLSCGARERMAARSLARQ